MAHLIYLALYTAYTSLQSLSSLSSSYSFSLSFQTPNPSVTQILSSSVPLVPSGLPSGNFDSGQTDWHLFVLVFLQFLFLVTCAHHQSAFQSTLKSVYRIVSYRIVQLSHGHMCDTMSTSLQKNRTQYFYVKFLYVGSTILQAPTRPSQEAE